MGINLPWHGSRGRGSARGEHRAGLEVGGDGGGWTGRTTAWAMAMVRETVGTLFQPPNKIEIACV